MAKTAYSKIFKRELEVLQLSELHQQYMKELKLEPDFRRFVALDIKCACCQVEGAILVNEGKLSNTEKIIKEAHFAFRASNGDDAHHRFCDHYINKHLKYSDSCNVNFNNSKNQVTPIIRKFICAGIENNIFNQQKISEMRGWFFKIRESQDFLIESSEYDIRLIKFIHSQKINNLDGKPFYSNEIDSLTYYSLSKKVSLPPFINNENFLSQRKEYWLINNNAIEKAIKISKKYHGLFGFDRGKHEEIYIKTSVLACRIAKFSTKLLSDKPKNILKISSNNAVMAYAVLLLFISDWDQESAFNRHILICKIKEIKNENLGNVIGFNPFVDYQAWFVLKYALDIKKTSNWLKNIELNFEEEKQKVLNEKAKSHRLYLDQITNGPDLPF